ncbi:MAG: calcium-binding protein [Synechocystis sp.]
MKSEEQIRRDRIEDEIIVDCYDEYEQMAGWYCYLEDNLTFPFTAKSQSSKAKKSTKTKPLTVVGMADQGDCERDMLVMVALDEDDLEDQIPVALAKIEAIKADEATKEAIADWHYWVDGH